MWVRAVDHFRIPGGRWIAGRRTTFEIVGMRPGGVIAALLYVWMLAGCTPVSTAIVPAKTFVPTETEWNRMIPTALPSTTPEPSPEITATQAQSTLIQSWKSYPILPTLSPGALEIYQRGLVLGNNPRAFSKIGDGAIATNWFLTVYDQDPGMYDLGAHGELSSAINYFTGSFGRKSISARAGFNTTRILNPLFAMNDICEVEESPLACELRLHRPSFAVLSLGTNQVWRPEIFKEELALMVESCIEQGVVPILTTKGDNLEGDHRINEVIAATAVEYDIPLWNFWRAIQPLPGQGLQPDGEHLTWAENNFSDPQAMLHAWPVRNLTALQVLQGFMKQLNPE